MCDCAPELLVIPIFKTLKGFEFVLLPYFSYYLVGEGNDEEPLLVSHHGKSTLRRLL